MKHITDIRVITETTLSNRRIAEEKRKLEEEVNLNKARAIYILDVDRQIEQAVLHAANNGERSCTLFLFRYDETATYSLSYEILELLRKAGYYEISVVITEDYDYQITIKWEE